MAKSQSNADERTQVEQVAPDGLPAAVEVTKKQCPCGATVFQGPVQRGEFVDGAFVVRETVYACVRCHRVLPVEQMLEITVGW